MAINIDAINNGDITNLKTIRKKLKLGMADMIRAQKLQNDPNVTPEEAARKLLKVPDGVDLNDYLESRLTTSEIATIKKLMS